MATTTETPRASSGKLSDAEGGSWGPPVTLDGALCRRCPMCTGYYHIGWFQYHEMAGPACRNASGRARPHRAS